MTQEQQEVKQFCESCYEYVSGEKLEHCKSLKHDISEEAYTDSAIRDRIKDFFTSFKKDEKFVYLDKIEQLITRDFISIDPQDFYHFKFSEGLDLYNYLINKPTEFIKNTKDAINEIYFNKYDSKKDFEIIIYEVERKLSITEALGNEYINNIATLNGTITSKTSIFNLPEEKIYVCLNNHTTRTKIKPVKCSDPKCSYKFDNLKERTDLEKFSRHRTIYLKSENEEALNQEDELRIDVKNALCDHANIGDRIKVTGIIETDYQEKTKNYHNILRCLGIQKLDDIDLSITSDDEKQFKELPNQDDFYTRLIHSIAPSIYGWVNVKESILFQLMGSPLRIKKDGTKVRGVIHIGLFGDPGTAKSKFGEWITSTFHRSQMIMGKGATAKGLIMGLEDGPDGRKVLRSGAMVNCRDGGTVVLDEFPRTDKEVIDGLYTTAESGEGSISKTGFQTKVKANANLLLTGNAHDGKWSENLTISENLAVDTTFLTRIDFTWVFIDKYDQKTDDLLSDAILEDVDYEDEVKPFSDVMLQKYLKYCKQFKPQLTKEVNENLKKAYLELRKDKLAKENGITLRHLESMIRSTRAIARLHQKEFCTVEDADKAIELMRKMFEQQNISISQADTYIQRNLNKAVNVLFEESIEGLEMKSLFEKILQYGKNEDQEQAKADLGMVNDQRLNKKWRSVIDTMKRSPRLKIISRKPLIFAYDHSKGDLRNYSK